jgi:hypothetical protein
VTHGILILIDFNTILYENEFQNPQIFTQTISLFLEHSTLHTITQLYRHFASKKGGLIFCQFHALTTLKNAFYKNIYILYMQYICMYTKSGIFTSLYGRKIVFKVGVGRILLEGESFSFFAWRAPPTVPARTIDIPTQYNVRGHVI